MTKEKFQAYEVVRESGLTNMFDLKAVVRLSCDMLSKEDCLDIMKNYGKYKAEFNS